MMKVLLVVCCFALSCCLIRSDALGKELIRGEGLKDESLDFPMALKPSIGAKEAANQAVHASIRPNLLFPHSPTKLPTFFPILNISPTKLPTSFPILNTDVYKMYILQTLNGVTAAEFDAEKTLNSLIFSSTVADCMLLIDASEVVIVSVNDITLVNTTVGVAINYTVEFDVSAMGFLDDVTGAYDFLADKLEKAVNGTTFFTFLTLEIALRSANHTVSCLSNASESALVNLYHSAFPSSPNLPSVAPTPFPSVDTEPYTMFIRQTLYGINAAAFNAEKSLNSLIFTSAVADCMLLIEASDVVIISVNDTTLVNTSSSVLIDYSVDYDAVSLGFVGDAVGAYNHLVNELQSAVNGTSFMTFLFTEITLRFAWHNSSLFNVTGCSMSPRGYTPMPSSTTNSTSDSPSEAPATAPTASPDFEMSVSQTLVGVSAAEFNLNLTLNSLIFTSSVVDCMPLILLSDVVVHSVTDGPAASAATSLRRRLDPASSVTLLYTVAYNTVTLGYSGDAEGAYEYLAGEIVSAVNGTSFLSFLQQEVQANGGNSPLSDVTSSTVTPQGYSAASVDDDAASNDNSSSKEHLAKKWIILIAVLGGVFCLAIVAISLFCCFVESAASYCCCKIC